MTKKIEARNDLPIFVQINGQRVFARIAQSFCPQDKRFVCDLCSTEYAANDKHIHIPAQKGKEPYCVAEKNEERCGGNISPIATEKLKSRLGGDQELVDVTLLDRVETPMERYDDETHALVVGRPFVEYQAVGGVSNVPRAMTIKDRTDGTWWPRGEDVAQSASDAKGGN